MSSATSVDPTGPSVEPATSTDSVGLRLQAADLARVALYALQFGGLVLLVWAFEIESRSLFEVLVLAFVGFLIHVWLPADQRLRLYGALSVASVLLVLGWSQGGVVLGIGALLIGLCHLPVRFGIRVGLVLAVGTALFALRNAPWPTGLPTVAWPVLGSMFMFRLALYLYSIRHRDAPTGPAWSVAYSFMLPNVCFPLFPVVDYKTFVGTHFDAERFRIYDRGIRWMFRGVLQLLLYRIVYYDLALGGLFVDNLGEVVRHVVSTFLLYVKISGQFHLIVGLLHLFGFRLPETNHLYFLSSSFTDLWRRINIYWKDFMMKMVYYPAYFRLRRHGKVVGIIASTLIVFFATWALHAYQFYWIAGSRLVKKRDILFWSILAVLVLGSTLWELRPGRRVSRTGRGWSLSRAVGTVGTFAVIAVLWSLWSAESGRCWLFMWTRVAYSQPSDWLLLGGLVAAGLVVAGFAWGAPTLTPPESTREPIAPLARRSSGRLVAMAALLFLAAPAVRAALPPDLARLVNHLRGQGQSLLDAALELQGYYEALTPQKGQVFIKPWREPWHYDDVTKTAAYVESHDFMLDGWKPDASITFQGQPLHTNRWGMRDWDHELAKPPGTFRIAMMGASDVLGWGVRDGESFPAIMEARLDSLARERGSRVEVLNFAATAVSLAFQVYGIETRARPFSPDLILLTAYPDRDIWTLQRQMQRIHSRGIEIPDPELSRLMHQALGENLDGDLGDLRPAEEAIDTRLFQWAKELAGRSGARVALALMRSPGTRSVGNYATEVRALSATGLPWMDCTEVWRGRDTTKFRVSLWDAHPNVEGHKVIAACLSEQLIRLAPDLGIPVGAPADDTAPSSSARRVP
jgi:hypothetical protein